MKKKRTPVRLPRRGPAENLRPAGAHKQKEETRQRSKELLKKEEADNATEALAGC